MGEASSVLRAASGLLEAVASVLRQIVHVVGWLVLLVGSVNLLLDPHPSLGHLIVPGAGSLAVIQGLIKPRRRNEDTSTLTVQDIAEEPSDVETLHGAR
jgi:hypothetical protein